MGHTRCYKTEGFLHLYKYKVTHNTTSVLCSCSWLYQCVRRVVTVVMTAQTMSFRYELACKGHSTEKAQDLVTSQNDLCCFV